MPLINPTARKIIEQINFDRINTVYKLNVELTHIQRRLELAIERRRAKLTILRKKEVTMKITSEEMSNENLIIMSMEQKLAQTFYCSIVFLYKEFWCMNNERLYNKI
jgi:hypothetical protein